MKRIALALVAFALVLMLADTSEAGRRHRRKKNRGGGCYSSCSAPVSHCSPCGGQASYAGQASYGGCASGACSPDQGYSAGYRGVHVERRTGTPTMAAPNRNNQRARMNNSRDDMPPAPDSFDNPGVSNDPGIGAGSADQAAPAAGNAPTPPGNRSTSPMPGGPGA